MEESFLAVVKQAFFVANVNQDCTFKFTTKEKVVAVQQIAQCIVEYEEGNEYIRLDKLIEAFRAHGDIELIEYRGQGKDDKNQLLFEFKFEKQSHQVIYILPQG